MRAERCGLNNMYIISVLYIVARLALKVLNVGVGSRYITGYGNYFGF